MKLIHYNLIGGSSNDQSLRRVGMVTQAGGWTEFIERRIKPIYELGVDRFWLHWPFGQGYWNGPLDGDSTVWAQWQAANVAAHWLTRDFHKAWTLFHAMVERDHRADAFELVCYLGRPYGDKSMPDGRTVPWLHRAIGALDFMPARIPVSIGIDAASGVPCTEPDYELAALLDKLGHRIYCESRPMMTDPRWARFNVVSNERFWHVSDPEKNPAASWAVPTSAIQGEIVRLVNDFTGPGQTWDDLTWMVETARAIDRDGHTTLTDLSLLQERGLLSQLMRTSA